MLKLVLNDESELEVKDGSTLFDLMVNPEQYNAMWEKLTVTNLQTAKIIDENGNLIDQLSGLTVDSESSTKIKGEVDCHFYLREKTDVEKLQEAVALLSESASVQDGAINDLAIAVSDLAEQGGHV